MIEQLYFSVVDLHEIESERIMNLLGSELCIPERKELLSDPSYVWGIWDIYPSFDVYRPPILSGLTESKAEILSIAEQYGLDEKIKFNNTHHFNELLNTIINYEGALISRQKKVNNYVIGVWNNTFEYLCGNEPINLNEQASESTSLDIILKYSNGNPCAHMYKGDYIKNFIKKREAIKKLNTPLTMCTDAILINFVYANHLEGYCAKTTQWQRHRIIKETNSHIFIDKYPFCGTSYLRQGWQARIVYSIMLEKKAFMSKGEFYHKSLRMHFYAKGVAKEKAKSYFKKENFENDAIYEVPINSVQWALNLLDIHKWPATLSTIKHAFRIVAMKHHPDRGGNAEVFVKCKTAQEFLIDKLV